MPEACRNSPKTTQSCSCCHKSFYTVLNYRFKYFSKQAGGWHWLKNTTISFCSFSLMMSSNLVSSCKSTFNFIILRQFYISRNPPVQFNVDVLSHSISPSYSRQATELCLPKRIMNSMDKISHYNCTYQCKHIEAKWCVAVGRMNVNRCK